MRSWDVSHATTTPKAGDSASSKLHFGEAFVVNPAVELQGQNVAGFVHPAGVCALVGELRASSCRPAFSGETSPFEFCRTDAVETTW